MYNLYLEYLKYTGTHKNNLNDSFKQEFIKGIYCKNHNFAAMLGFIIDGKPEKCVTKVQQRMNKLSKKINLEENWDKEERFGKHSHLYRTCHRQVDHNNNLITILHLFVDLNPL